METQIATCGEHYQMWKDKALFTNDINASKKAVERAFFWMELRAAFLFLMSIEKTNGSNPEVKSKLIRAKLNLSRKLSYYLKEILSEIG